MKILSLAGNSTAFKAFINVQKQDADWQGANDQTINSNQISSYNAINGIAPDGNSATQINIRMQNGDEFKKIIHQRGRYGIEKTHSEIMDEFKKLCNS